MDFLTDGILCSHYVTNLGQVFFFITVCLLLHISSTHTHAKVLNSKHNVMKSSPCAMQPPTLWVLWGYTSSLLFLFCMCFCPCFFLCSCLYPRHGLFFRCVHAWSSISLSVHIKPKQKEKILSSKNPVCPVKPESCILFLVILLDLNSHLFHAIVIMDNCFCLPVFWTMKWTMTMLLGYAPI